MCMALNFRIKDGIKHVGVAYIDSVDRKLGVSEFVETDIFSNTEVGPLNLALNIMIVLTCRSSLYLSNWASKKSSILPKTRAARQREPNCAS